MNERYQGFQAIVDTYAPCLPPIYRRGDRGGIAPTIIMQMIIGRSRGDCPYNNYANDYRAIAGGLPLQ
ncbi:MAG: hypothetical protein ACBR11_27115 [Microcoleus sp.]|uniref:hypothetical protein n=1 Tax=Microcoleus sp. TaxID=44472 RepID=UPI0035231AAC